jgi:putative ABC transport system permease protein
MRLADLVRFAGRALGGHGLRTGFSLLGVAIGVASVITLTGLGEGARSYITSEFTSLGTNLLTFVPGKTETRGGAPLVSATTNDLTVADAEALARRVPQLRRVAPISMGTAPAGHGDRSRNIVVLGTTPAYLAIRHLRMASGRYLPPDEPNAPVCVLGSKVASELFGSNNPLGQMIRLGQMRFRVLGVLAPRGQSVGMNMDDVVHIPVRSGLRLFNRTGLFRIVAEVSSSQAVPAAEKEALAVLQERHGGVEDVTAVTQDAVMATFDRIFNALTLALAGIAAISLAVAGIGIMNVMLVSVSERRPEIGLLKAVGVTRGQIIAVFLVEAAFISTAGGLAGLAGGFGAGRLLQHIVPELPAAPPGWAVVSAVLVSVSVGVLFGSLPARKAANLDPVEALMRSRA